MDSNKMLELILKELVEVKVGQNETKAQISELDQRLSKQISELDQEVKELDQKFSKQIGELNQEVKEINQKVDRLQFNQGDIIKELSYGFSLTGKSRTAIELVQKDIVEIKSTLDYHNLGENKQKLKVEAL